VNHVRLTDAGDGEWQVVVDGTGRDLEDGVARAIVGKGLKLRELRSRALTLEDVFLKLTRKGRSR
jgi:hypothetical protein